MRYTVDLEFVGHRQLEIEASSETEAKFMAIDYGAKCDLSELNNVELVVADIEEVDDD